MLDKFGMQLCQKFDKKNEKNSDENAKLTCPNLLRNKTSQQQ
jgi:hypothetical protein